MFIGGEPPAGRDSLLRADARWLCAALAAIEINFQQPPVVRTTFLLCTLTDFSDDLDYTKWLTLNGLNLVSV